MRPLTSDGVVMEAQSCNTLTGLLGFFRQFQAGPNTLAMLTMLTMFLS
jgi:hypothetical protein